MLESGRIATIALAALFLAGVGAGLAQQEEIGEGSVAPNPIPPPLPPPERSDDDATRYESVLEESDLPWGLDDSLLKPLFERAAVYRAYTRRFTCVETARLADYGSSGEAKKEKTRRYGYLLVQDPAADDVREFRQTITKDGKLKRDEVEDEEPFPPAYAWVFLFSRFHEPYFAYRSMGDRFDGFDWVYEIQFKGSLPFTDGKDIRQWEGVALIDAVTYTPLEIRAEPTGQADRINAMFDRWTKSFNLLGLKLGEKPLGFRAQIQFRHRREGLTFPTELRYDTFRAITGNQTAPVKASTRTYDEYRITRVTAEPTVGETSGN